MSDTDSMKQTVCDAIDAEADQIVGLGEAIMDEPELGFKETKTAARVEDLFQSAGLQSDSGLALTGVRAARKACPTAWRTAPPPRPSPTSPRSSPR